MTLRIKRFIQEDENFINVNYNVLPFVCVKEIVDGELAGNTYYFNYDNETKTGDIIVKETITYERLYGYIQTRLKIIEWYNTDETVGYTKKLEKYYTTAEATSAGEKNRKYKIDEVKGNVVMLIAQSTPCDVPTAEVMGGAFIMANQDNIGMYVGGVPTPLLDAITASTLTRMDNEIEGVSIRNFMSNYLA